MSEVQVKVDGVILNGSIVKADAVPGIGREIQTALQSMLPHDGLAGLKSSNLDRVVVQHANSGTTADSEQMAGTLARIIFEAIMSSK